MQARQLNPHQTARFVHNMRRLNPVDQADVALKWRERAVNVMAAFNPGPVGTTVQILSSSAYGGALGAWDGHNEAKRAALIEEWKTSTAPALQINTGEHDTPFRDVVDANGQIIHKAIPDPRAWFGLNKTLYPTLGMGIAAAVAAVVDEGTAAVPYLTALTIGGTSYIVGTTIRDAVYKKTRDAQRAAPLPQVGPASNPRRYSRAA